MQKPAGLHVKEATELLEGIGMQPAETAVGTGQAVCTRVGQIGRLAQSVCRNAALGHEFVYSEPHHKTFPVEPRGHSV